MMSSVVLVAIVTLATGLVSLALGLLARSARVALGCLVIGFVVIAGFVIALFIWDLWSGYHILHANKLWM
jgi:hypothetical protein